MKKNVNKNKQKLVNYWNNLTIKQMKKLCKDTGNTESYLKSVFFCFAQCGAMTAMKIDKATNGKVTKQELRPNLDW